jgi:hypothetical protein
MGGKRQANIGSAGVPAPYERKARKSCSVKKFEIERAAHALAGEGARAPSNQIVPDISTFWAKPVEGLVHIERTAVRFRRQVRTRGILQDLVQLQNICFEVRVFR